MVVVSSDLALGLAQVVEHMPPPNAGIGVAGTHGSQDSQEATPHYLQINCYAGGTQPHNFA